MPSPRMTRQATKARSEVLDQLMEDHKRVKKAYREFQKLDIDADSEVCQGLVQLVLQDLTVHAALEEELLYPAARAAIADDDLMDEAEVEHESMHALIEPLRGMSPGDDKYAARFTVLCEYVLHHVKEEESEMFPLLESARLDWEELALQISERRTQMTGGVGTEGGGGATEAEADAETTAPAGRMAKPARGNSRHREQPV